MASIHFSFGAKPTQRAERRISHETGSGRGPREDRESRLTKEDRREQSAWDSRPEKDTVGRRRLWEDGSRAEKRVNRGQKDDCQNLLTDRGRVNLREMSALLVAWENFIRVHAHVSWQNALCHRLPLAFGLNPSPCFFVCSFSPPFGCVLRIRKEMCNAPGRKWEKPLDDLI